MGDQKPLKVKKQKKMAKKSKMIQKRSNFQSSEVQLEGVSEHSDRSYKSQKTTQQRQVMAPNKQQKRSNSPELRAKEQSIGVLRAEEDDDTESFITSKKANYDESMANEESDDQHRQAQDNVDEQQDSPKSVLQKMIGPLTVQQRHDRICRYIQKKR